MNVNQYVNEQNVYCRYVDKHMKFVVTVNVDDSVEQ